jgi:hypothetical protein
MSEAVNPTFEEFRKIARLNRDCTITEKIDGTNAQIFIVDAVAEGLYPSLPPTIGIKDGLYMFAGSRNRWLNPDQDNFGFAKWVLKNADALFGLGPGRHYGEWWGNGIQRGYGLPRDEKRFSLFNTHKWTNGMNGSNEASNIPPCCHVVPVLYQGPFNTLNIVETLNDLRDGGSKAAPFLNPEGIVIYHTHASQYFKVTLKDDEMPKSLVKNVA